MTAQPIAEPAAAVVDQLRVQPRKARRPWHRHQKVPPDPANQSLNLAFIVALAGAAEAIIKQVVRLQLAENPRPLSCSVTQNPGHGDPGVVIEDRLRHTAEEREGRRVAGAKRFRRLRRISLHKAGIAVRQVKREEVDLLFHPADLGQRFPKVGLGVSRLMAERYEHLPLPKAAIVHVILHDRQPAGKAVLVSKTLEDPLRRVTLLRRTALILLKNPVDDPDERVQLRARRRLAPPVTRRHREHHHLGNRPRVDPKPPRRLALAQSLNLHRIANPSVELHALHPPPPADSRQKAICCRIFTPAQPDNPALYPRSNPKGKSKQLLS